MGVVGYGSLEPADQKLLSDYINGARRSLSLSLTHATGKIYIAPPVKKAKDPNAAPSSPKPKKAKTSSSKPKSPPRPSHRWLG